MTTGADNEKVTGHEENRSSPVDASAGQEVLAEAFADWRADWIARPEPDHRSWDMHALEVQVSAETGGSAEILFAVRDAANCRVCRLDAAEGSVTLLTEKSGERLEHARAQAAELGSSAAASGVSESGESGEVRQAGPNEAEAVARAMRSVSVRIVQDGANVRVTLNGREALQADLTGDAAGHDAALGTVGFRGAADSAAVFRELRVFDGQDRALYVNRFYDPSTLHFDDGEIDPSGNGLKLAPGRTALCENPLPVDAPLFRRAFELPSKPTGARLRVYALGWYELSLNGRKVGDRVLAPANSPYEQRLLFDTYEGEELLELLREGTNVWGAMLGGGYNFNYSRWGWKWKRDKAWIAQLDLTLADGSVLTVGTDEFWSTAPGPLLMHDIYDGETFDARLLPEGWNEPFSEEAFASDSDLDSSERSRERSETLPKQAGWQPAVKAPAPEGASQPNGQPPVRAHEPLRPVCAYQPEPGVTVYDFGQNIAGWARIRVRGRAGDRIALTYSELIDEQGRIDPWTNRNARARDVYVLNGAGEESYEPRFTYHGFRYAEVRAAESVGLIRIEAVPVHADVRESGSFRSSDPLLEQIQDNIRRSILNNLVSIPTDCCQRDERTPCLMDSAVVEEASIHNFDMKAYYRKWIGDIAGSDSNPDWSGDRVTLPWHLHRHYGDLGLLREGYPSMKAYIEYLAGRWPEHTVTEGFGDWCPPNDDGWENYFGEPELVNTALYAMQAGVAAEAAAALEEAEDAARFEALAAEIRAAFGRRFGQGGGVYGSGSQTAQLLPLAFGLVPEAETERAVARLVAAIEEKGGHLDTGIYGTRHLLDVLADHGRIDLAYELLRKKTYPSFGWQIEQGATTLWEQWSFKGGMHSHDHAMFGGIGASFYTRLAGIVPLEPGYAKIGIRPYVPAGLDWIEAELNTPVGRIFSGWRREDNRLTFAIGIPEGASAEAVLPVGTERIGTQAIATERMDQEIGRSPQETREASGTDELARRTFVLGPGRHEFALPLSLLPSRV
ncbi:alpha-L-rhamnosidase [Saccharibacillus sp. O23]|uniref:alpha-L-rhamnosidase n=1 Tax=Saccharibacillus sp. O23 TaxID=2009338 RepID=UPI0015C5D271|nr:alpha-L-rhamnosidase [Saccharibacillus sp. O23]